MAKFKKGHSKLPGAGKKKGSKNKFTNLKDSFLEAFEATGGATGMIEWINKSPHNRGQFYSMITKMLPTNLTLEPTPDENGDKKFIIEVRHTKDEEKKV